MKNHSFRDIEGYQKYLAKSFEKRKVHLTKEQLRRVFAALGFEVDFSEVTVAHSGITSRVYLTPELAIKIRDRRSLDDNGFQFLANKIVSDHFYPELPVANVLAYDHFKKTDYEVLVMEKGEGKELIDDFIDLDTELQKELFGQVLGISNQLGTLTFNDWGDIRYEHTFKTFSDFLKAKVTGYSQKIIDQNFSSVKDISLIKDYFFDIVKIFDNEKTSHFVHVDINNANVLHDKDKVTLLFDFDAAVKGPKIMMLPKIISSIDNMEGLVAGTRYYKMYRNIKFEHLYPVLIKKMPDLFSDRDLARKLNLMFIYRELQLVAKNRFLHWNRMIIKDVIDCEIAKNNNSLSRTYYSQILKKIGL